MTKYLDIKVRVPIREAKQDDVEVALENAPNEFFDEFVRIMPSDIHGVHSIVFDEDTLIDSLAEVVNVKVVEE